ncbi:MAG: diguanylate cyclase [Candidatus Limiplasma sp.]|nr:diguanylate cyclase [Candidatus Limiplasma sp.]
MTVGGVRSAQVKAPEKSNRFALTLQLGIIFAFFCGFLLLAAWKPDWFQLTDRLLYQNQARNTLPYLQYFITDDPSLTVEDVAGNPRLPFRIAASENEICLGPPTEYVWLRFIPAQIMDNLGESDHILFYDDSCFLDWTLYRPISESGRLIYQEAVRPEGDAQSAIYPHVIIQNDDVHDAYYYLAYPKENMAHRLLLDRQDHFLEMQNRIINLMALCIGCVFGMIIMNLMMLHSTHERQYLFHAIFQGCALCMLVYLSAMTLWIDGKVYGLLVLKMQVITVMAFGFFFYHFQDIRHHHAMLAKVYRLLLWIGSVLAGLSLALKYDQLLWYSQLVSGLFLLFVGGVASILFISKDRVTVRFLVGIYLAITAGLLSSLSVMGLIPLSFTTYYFIFPAFAVKSLLFSSSITSAIRAQDTANRTLRVEAHTDSLTGLHNRHYIENEIKPEMLALEKQSKVTSMIMIDIDHFKAINDTHGHDAGDRVLNMLSHIAREFFRSTDSVTRWGGEEFAVFLPATTLKQATEAGERFRRKVEAWIFYDVGSLTVSMGVAEKAVQESFEQWFKRADNAMYISKKTGRNRIEVSYPLLDENNRPIQLLWDPAYNSHHAVIDAEHKHLLAQVNNLLQHWYVVGNVPKPTEEIDRLLAEVSRHFADEEAILDAIHFPYTDEHRLEHKRLMQKAALLSEAITHGGIELTHLLEFVVGEVVIGHMKQEDIHYFRYITPSV